MGRTPQKRTPKKRHFLGDSDSDSSYLAADDDFSSSEEEDEFEDDEMPCEDRLIVETSRALQSLVEKYAKCPKCNTAMNLSFGTMTVASWPKLECMSPLCGFKEEGDRPSGTDLQKQFNDNYIRNTDYTVNVLYVLAHICSGDGATEAGRLLGLLGLPRSTTMEATNFAKIEDRIAPSIKSVSMMISC